MAESDVNLREDAWNVAVIQYLDFGQLNPLLRLLREYVGGPPGFALGRLADVFDGTNRRRAGRPSVKSKATRSTDVYLRAADGNIDALIALMSEHTYDFPGIDIRFLAEQLQGRLHPTRPRGEMIHQGRGWPSSRISRAVRAIVMAQLFEAEQKKILSASGERAAVGKLTKHLIERKDGLAMSDRLVTKRRLEGVKLLDKLNADARLVDDNED